MKLEFKAWPKIPRFSNERYYVTEKIDGTNACIIITPDGVVGTQSRNRLITPEDDNYGFARWVQENKEDLLKLGEGYHYGEWWGLGINRGYGLDHKRFSLFSWWTEEDHMPSCCHRIPLLSSNSTLEDLKDDLSNLIKEGSKASPGFMKIEGIVVCSKSNHSYYKIIHEK